MKKQYVYCNDFCLDQAVLALIDEAERAVLAAQQEGQTLIHLRRAIGNVRERLKQNKPGMAEVAEILKNSDIRALSIKQPWAWLIVHSYKDVENRTWRTNLRGQFLIHASKTFDDVGYRWVQTRFRSIRMPAKAEYQRGGIVGIATLVDCVTYHSSQWFFGPYGFVIEEAYPIPFAPCNGRLGFFPVELTDSVSGESK